MKAEFDVVCKAAGISHSAAVRGLIKRAAGKRQRATPNAMICDQPMPTPTQPDTTDEPGIERLGEAVHEIGERLGHGRLWVSMLGSLVLIEARFFNSW